MFSFVYKKITCMMMQSKIHFLKFFQYHHTISIDCFWAKWLMHFLKSKTSLCDWVSGIHSVTMLMHRQCHFLTWCFVVQYSLWISMCNWVWKMPRTVIFSKIGSVILDMEKLEDCLSEDFLSILKPSEITK